MRHRAVALCRSPRCCRRRRCSSSFSASLPLAGVLVLASVVDRVAARPLPHTVAASPAAAAAGRPPAYWCNGGSPALASVATHHGRRCRRATAMVREHVRAAPDVCLSTDSDGRTPLHLAAMKGRVEIMKELFSSSAHGVEVNALNKNGLTALDILLQSTVRDPKDLEISEVLRGGAGGLSVQVEEARLDFHKHIFNMPAGYVLSIIHDDEL
ncbi:hypothetical protein Syun_026492 [Stephania yunnanensis]|uniref:Uncharacterized protein n=1 Tax=Stephania yunnanensis TaxID=152371 RepID=A0AAP0HVT3_9MAGN